MTEVPISELPAAGALTGSEPIPIVQGGVTKQSTVGDVAKVLPVQVVTLDGSGTTVLDPTQARAFALITSGDGTYEHLDVAHFSRPVNNLGPVYSGQSINVYIRTLTAPGDGVKISEGGNYNIETLNPFDKQASRTDNNGIQLGGYEGYGVVLTWTSNQFGYNQPYSYTSGTTGWEQVNLNWTAVDNRTTDPTAQVFFGGANSSTTSKAGYALFYGGDNSNVTGGGDGGDATLRGGHSISGNGGNVSIVTTSGGNVSVGSAGSIEFTNAGNTVSITASGAVMVSTLPTSDPHNAGQLWNSSGTVKISAG